jgi:hypothetical protein
MTLDSNLKYSCSNLQENGSAIDFWRWNLLEQEVLGKTNCLLSFHCILCILFDTERTENTTFNSYIVVCLFVAVGTVFLCRCLVTAVSSGSTIP